MTVVLVLGSGPNVTTCRDWPRAPFDHIVAINNAWAVRPDWDYLIHPDDFPSERRPEKTSDGQSIVTSADYVPVQNTFGGFVYAGGTMAFTAAYWALGALKPRVIAMLGCDMVYPVTQHTHFYGQGTADPLRKDVTLRSLEAKSNRLAAFAAQQGCAMINLSQDASRLTFPRFAPQDAASAKPAPLNAAVVAQAIAQEAKAGYFVPSGKYWAEEDQFNVDVIDAIDALWLKAAHVI